MPRMALKLPGSAAIAESTMSRGSREACESLLASGVQELWIESAQLFTFLFFEPTFDDFVFATERKKTDTPREGWVFATRRRYFFCNALKRARESRALTGAAAAPLPWPR